jgi:hypothetical protein
MGEMTLYPKSLAAKRNLGRRRPRSSQKTGTIFKIDTAVLDLKAFRCQTSRTSYLVNCPV